MIRDYEETPDLKKHPVKDSPFYANKDVVLKRIKELKSINKIFSMRCSNFPERSSSYELESDKPVLPEIEHLRVKIGE